MAIAIAPPPDRLLPPEVFVFDRTCGAVVVVEAAGPEGKPGEKGLEPLPLGVSAGAEALPAVTVCAASATEPGAHISAANRASAQRTIS
jgi:hypothetical protein